MVRVGEEIAPFPEKVGLVPDLIGYERVPAVLLAPATGLGGHALQKVGPLVQPVQPDGAGLGSVGLSHPGGRSIHADQQVQLVLPCRAHDVPQVAPPVGPILSYLHFGPAEEGLDPGKAELGGGRCGCNVGHGDTVALVVKWRLALDREGRGRQCSANNKDKNDC